MNGEGANAICDDGPDEKKKTKPKWENKIKHSTFAESEWLADWLAGYARAMSRMTMTTLSTTTMMMEMINDIVGSLLWLIYSSFSENGYNLFRTGDRHHRCRALVLAKMMGSISSQTSYLSFPKLAWHVVRFNAYNISFMAWVPRMTLARSSRETCPL